MLIPICKRGSRWRCNFRGGHLDELRLNDRAVIPQDIDLAAGRACGGSEPVMGDEAEEEFHRVIEGPADWDAFGWSVKGTHSMGRPFTTMGVRTPVIGGDN